MVRNAKVSESAFSQMPLRLDAACWASACCQDMVSISSAKALFQIFFIGFLLVVFEAADSRIAAYIRQTASFRHDTQKIGADT